MSALEKVIQRFFFHAELLEARLSEEWRKGANQRTILILMVCGALFLYLYTMVVVPPAAFPVDELVEVPDGLGLAEVSVKLEEQQVIRSQIALRLLVTVLGHETGVRAGDYLFKEPKDLFSIARAITTGAYGLEPEKVRIHEGATTSEIAKIFSTRLKRVDATRFLSKSQMHEGYLFPDTYFFLPNVLEDTIIETMRQNFETNVEQIQTEIDAFGKPLNEVVIMASLVEREAHNYKDRQMIAGVLWNRIRRNMLLQVDAAFLYTLGKGTFDLTLDDLASDSPYNTYKHKGLPPTAIGNPSLDAMRATVTPVEHKYLYYLADNNGVTYYSVTYEEHLRKKRLYLGT